MTERRIVACEIDKPGGICDPLPKVHVQFDDGEAKSLFEFFPDEIRFSEAEFLGLTEKEARALRHRRDVAYLQS